MMRRRAVLLLAVALAGCKSLPDKPKAQTMYDFGPAAPTPTVTLPARPALLLPEVEVSGVLETTALLYRRGYEDAHQLRP